MLLLVTTLTTRASTILVNDPFIDGNRTNASGGDSLGLIWYMGNSSASLVVTNDDAGIGLGNALFYTPSGGFGKYLAYFGPVTLTGPGDSITLQFDYRFTVAPTNLGAGFRVGLYNTMGTRQSTDASDTGSGPGNRSDDVGYGFQTNPGTNVSNGTTVYSEAAGNDILGGASPSQTANQGTAGASVNSGTNKHTAVFQISRQPNGDLALSAQIDNNASATATIAAASVFTNTFDEVGISEGGTGYVFPWFIDNVTISSTAADDFDKLRVKWWQLQTGGTNYSLSDSLVKSRLNTISNNCYSSWTPMDKTGTNTYLWSDLTSTTDSGEISTAYSRLLNMALAYATYGCFYRSNAALAADIQTGLNWMYTHRYNDSVPAPSGEYDNWYDWEIGAPLSIVDIGVYMYDALGLTGLSNTLSAMDHFVPSPFSGTSGTSTGGNLTDKIRTVAVRGAVVKDASKVAAARDAFSTLFNYVTTGDGYYSDGSFVQHTRHPYNGSYGSVAIGDVSLVLPWLIGSPWQCTDADQTNVLQWVYNSYEPFVYSGAMMDMTRGRAVSRSSNQDHTAGSGIVKSLLTLAVSAFPAPAEAARIKGLVKYEAQVDTFRNFTSNIPLQLHTQLQQVMNDTNVVPRGELLGHWTFASMDQAVHLRPGWGLAVSMSSSRIYNYESINSENLHGWFQGDGMTYIYNGDLAQFSDDFWPTVDPYRLPGTTVDTTTRADASGQSYLSSKNWVGGATLFTNGIAGMDIAPYNTPLLGKKSWFMLDDEVVCLGAGIICTNSADIQTTLENRKISASNTNLFTVGGVSMPTTLGWTTNLTNISWCALAGAGGYYFPSNSVVKAVREARTGSWSQINGGGSASSTTKNYLTLWIDHGVKPTNTSYAFVLLPNYTTLQTSNYAASPEMTILENSTNAQAVKETTMNVVAANFWTNGTKTVDLITVNKKCSVMTRETTTNLAVAISDPTQTNNGAISVTLNRAANSVISCDPLITITQLHPTIQMTVDVAVTLGRSLVARFNLANSAPNLSPITNRTINSGITLLITNSTTDADLPYQTVAYSLSNAPTYATINTNTGVFTWRPATSQAGTTNLLAVIVRDDGSPSLSATQSFIVVVRKLNAPVMTPFSSANPSTLQITGDFGPDYSIQASINLADWSTVFTTNQPTLPLTWTDPAAAAFVSRFYRVRLGP